MSLDPLTPRQAETLAFLHDRFAEKQVMPTQRETADHFRVQRHAVAVLFDVLERKGHISREFHKARSMRLLGPRPEGVK